MVKQLIYDSRMIVKKETIISACYDIQSSHKKHDGMIVVFLKSIIVLTNLNRKCRFIRYFSLERKVTKSSRLNRLGYSGQRLRCRLRNSLTLRQRRLRTLRLCLQAFSAVC